MLRVRIHLFSPLKERVGAHRLEVPAAEGATLEDVLAYLAERCDPLFDDLLRGSADQWHFHMLIADGQRLRLPDDKGHRVHDGEDVYLIPVLSGG